MKTLIRLSAGLLCVATAWGAVSPQDAARLGADLTPLGGEKAGNADGSIPAWTGGLKSPGDAGFPNYHSPDHYPDPYASDKPLFTITAANMAQYAAKLTEGHKALLKAYADYKMVVYPTHRSGASPESVYEATKRNATTARLVPDGNGFTGALGGTPFPIPQSGLEVLLEPRHALPRRDRGAAGRAGADDRRRQLHAGELQGGVLLPVLRARASPRRSSTISCCSSPRRRPHRRAWRGKCCWCRRRSIRRRKRRRAWVYNPGQRRVRRAPNVAFDNPGTNADNLRTADQFDMYNGSPQRYDWKLIGKREIYVPYDAYRLQDGKLKYADLLHKNHINQDLARYELHRVWVVDSTLKPGVSHIYSRRTLYVDEDSWQILAVDCYDSRGQLYRVQEGHAMNYYNLPSLWTSLELVMDLSNGRYLALGLQSEEHGSYDFSIKRTPNDYQPSVLERRGIR